MSKFIKWGSVALLTPVLLFTILFLLFYFPPFQRWAVKHVTTYASEKTGMQISVDHVSLSFPLDLALENVKVLQPNDSLPNVTDTVADIGKVVADVQLWPLLQNQVLVDELSFDQMTVNTSDFIKSVRIKGKVGQLNLKTNGVDLNKKLADVNDAQLVDSRLNIELSDTVPPDTARTPNLWKINIKQLKIKNSDLALHLSGDTMSVKAYMGDALIQKTHLDLEKSLYRVQHFELENGKVKYDRNFEPKVKGLDYSHLAFDDLNLKADSFYYCDSKLDLKIKESSFKEKSGLSVEKLQGRLAMDSTRLSLPQMVLQTSDGTKLAFDYDMDNNAFDNSGKEPGKFSANFKGQVAKRDMMTILGKSLPKELMRKWPNKPLVATGEVLGNLKKARFRDLNLSLPGAFKVKATGFAENLTEPKKLKANLDVNAKTDNLDFLTSMLDKDVRKSFRVPNGIAFNGNVKVAGNSYSSTFVAQQGGGKLQGQAFIDTDRMAYSAQLTGKSFPLQHFLPNQQLHPFTGEVDLTGQGFDVLSPKTQLTAKTKVQKFKYGNYNLDNVSMQAKVRNGRILADINSNNPLLKGNFTIAALTNQRKKIKATLSGDLSYIDLYNLHISEEPMSLGLCAHVDLESDLKNTHRVVGTLSDITFKDKYQTYRPDDVVLDFLTSNDTTHAVVDCADLHLNLNASGGIEQLQRNGKQLVSELQSQFKNKYIDQTRLRERLPYARIHLVSGKNNIMSHILNRYGYGLDNVYLDMVSSPKSGLNGSMLIDSLVVDSFQVDTVRFKVVSDESTMNYSAQLRNSKKNPKYVFNALFDGAINERGTRLETRVFDRNDVLGVRLALQGSMENNGVRIHLFGDEPVIGYKKFNVNDNNYIFLSDDKRVSADMFLRANDGTGIQIMTNDDNTEALQDITISMHKFNIGDALAMIPYTPDIEGILNGDFHLIQTPTDLSVSSSVDIAKLIYEKSPIGNVSSEFTYMPRDNGGHYVDGILLHEGREIGVLKGTYVSKGRGVLDATMDLDRLPMEFINGFIPQKIVGFKGYAEGSLAIKGALNRPEVNGELFLDSTFIYSEPYGVEMRFANDPVKISNSRLLFENFEMFAHNESPLNVQGYFDFSDMDRMNMNVKMRANNFLLVDAKENARSDVYGQAYVNYYGTMTGLLSNLRMRGRLDLLGTTDLKYNLKDSPLNTDNQLDGLVEFVNLKDTTHRVINRPPLTGLDMDLAINIDEGAHVDCYLNADHSNFIDIIGGGEMRLQYNVVDNVRLRGRYTIGGGEMKYSLPIIPLKTFTIQDGSYIEFRGDPMNPGLNLTATEELQTTVGGDGSDGHIVKFNCGVVVTKTLKDMGLEFVIDAPEDMTIHNQLQAMSKEERGKVAVTMLTTGMFLADGNMKGFTMNSALSAFLNSQINQISSKALRTLDVSFGVDNSISSSGVFRTNYSFKFAKRFWNNRLRIVIGGKLSSGPDVVKDNETFFDNVLFEYRLSPTSNKYLKLFYERDNYDWLDGNVGKYGGGFIWKRKLDRFKDIFRFNIKDTEPIPVDSVTKDTIRK